jgi:hypothetical protein
MHPHAHRRWTTLVHHQFWLVLLSLATELGPRTTALACDVCAVYTATEQGESRTGFRSGLAVQYTHYGTLQDDSHEVPNPHDESLDSVITQVIFGYQLTPRIGLQLNLPLITRQFERFHDGKRERGNVNGPGDMTIFGHVLVHSIITERSLFRFSLLGGLELPTGDPDRLGEELAETQVAGIRRRPVPRHVEPPSGGGDSGGAEHEESGVHGHDLALGSGSVDGLVGGDLFWSYDRFFVTGELHYAIRTEGAFEYTYANELTGSGGPGWYVLLDHDKSIALQAFFAVETKGNDEQAGRHLNDTAITRLYLGPAVLFTWGTSLSGEAGIDIPVYDHNTALQIVPDYRMRLAAIWRF